MTPLLFMGQEWAAASPFAYFTDHEAELGRQVTEGRRNEFSSFDAFESSTARLAIPDPQAIGTFTNSRLFWAERTSESHARILGLYKEALRLRREDPVLRDASRSRLRTSAKGDVLAVERWSGAGRRVLLVNFGGSGAPFEDLPVDVRSMSLLLASDWRGETPRAERADEALPIYTAMIFGGAPSQAS
jgi:maltooligosyltrehalose trehalohydrolase